MKTLNMAVGGGGAKDPTDAPAQPAPTKKTSTKPVKK